MKGQFRHFHRLWYFIPEHKLAEFDKKLEQAYSEYTTNNYYTAIESLEKQNNMYLIVNPMYYDVNILDEDLNNKYNERG